VVDLNERKTKKSLKRDANAGGAQKEEKGKGENFRTSLGGKREQIISKKTTNVKGEKIYFQSQRRGGG